MIRAEVSRLFAVDERHRRLLARLLVVAALSLFVRTVGTLLIWAFESGHKGGDIHGLGDAAFFTTVQLLTVSSQINNPLTSSGRIVDIGLELGSSSSSPESRGASPRSSAPATRATRANSCVQF